MVITRKSQVLLNFLDVRVVVNGNLIYPLPQEKAVVVALPQKPHSIVATDGFHISPKVGVPCRPWQACYVQVDCVIDDGLLYAGLVLLGAFFLVGTISDILVLKVLCFFPLLYFLYYYYLRRERFLQIKAVAK